MKSGRAAGLQDGIINPLINMMTVYYMESIDAAPAVRPGGGAEGQAFLLSVTLAVHHS
jgi:hypothetical protein